MAKLKMRKGVRVVLKNNLGLRIARSKTGRSFLHGLLCHLAVYERDMAAHHASGEAPHAY